MSININKLQSAVKRKYSFKYKPEFSESFSSTINNSQIIPLAIEVCKKLAWTIVFFDEKSVEAKRENNWGKFTEKVVITKKSSGRIEVHSITIKGNFIDYGRNSKRTGLFIALFQQLVNEYESTEKLTEIEIAHEKLSNWEDYEVPTEFPKPVIYKESNVGISIVGGLIIAIISGILIGFLNQNIGYIIGLYEFGLGLGIGYLFGQVLKKTNYSKFKIIQLMLTGMMLVMLLTNLLTQYVLITMESNISGLSFFEFLNLRLEAGLMIKELNVGWIGLVLSWLFLMIFTFFIAQSKTAMIIINHDIKKVPEEVIEYTIYLFEMGKTENEVRAELSGKGWKTKESQQNIFNVLGAFFEFQQMKRE